MSTDAKKSEIKKLVGWLVSFQTNAKGSYYELREGRQFISSTSISGEKQITLTDSGIGAAHLALNVSREEGVVVQDVFSSGGTFLKHLGHHDEMRLSEKTKLGHGDLLRIGDGTQLQLCLIEQLES